MNSRPISERTIVGFTEKVKINGHECLALIDSGAARSSIDLGLASKLRLGPIVRRSVIRTSHGKTARPVIKTSIEIGSRKIKAFFNISTREKMKYRILIGRNILRRGFLIDPAKKAA